MSDKKKIIVIGGPTATGKTKLSVELSKKYNGEIISADSMQIYKYLDIGSAKPTEEEKEGIPHYMIDEVSPFDAFSVADFTQRAKKYADDIISRGRLPIIVGGTGLYISSFIDNVEFSDAAPDDKIRQNLNKKLEEIGAEGLYNILKEVDEKASQAIHPNNTKRVIRALEIFYSTGKTMTEQNMLSKLSPSPYEPLMLALCAPREILYERINLRVDKMMEAGLLDEIKNLLDMGLTCKHQAMQGIGYKEFIPYFEGNAELSDVIEQVKQNSRRYAKRQLTWFKRDERYNWIDISDTEAAYKAAEEFLGHLPE